MILNLSFNVRVKSVIKFKCQLLMNEWNESYLIFIPICNRNCNSIYLIAFYFFFYLALLKVTFLYIFGVFVSFLFILEQCAPPDRCVTKTRKIDLQFFLLSTFLLIFGHFGIFGRFLSNLDHCAPPDQCVTKHEKSIYPELGSSSKFLHDSSVTAVICKI